MSSQSAISGFRNLSSFSMVIIEVFAPVAPGAADHALKFTQFSFKITIRFTAINAKVFAEAERDLTDNHG